MQVGQSLAPSLTALGRVSLRVLEADSLVRADVVRQFYERGDHSMVEVLPELEADPVLRAEAVIALRAADDHLSM